MALQVSPSASSKIRRARRAKSARTALPLACCRSSTISASVKFIVSSKEVIYYLFKRYGPVVSGERLDGVGCAQPSERNARRIACQYRAYWQAMQRRDALRWPAQTDR